MLAIYLTTYSGNLNVLITSAADSHHIDADPESTYYPAADSDFDFYLMWIRSRIFI
jgi:hypothetical protein